MNNKTTQRNNKNNFNLLLIIKIILISGLIFTTLQKTTKETKKQISQLTLKEEFSIKQKITENFPQFPHKNNITLITCNVLNFGAKGNGREDDTSAIRNTILNCGNLTTNSPNLFKIIYFPSSYRFLTGAMNISTQQIFYIAKSSEIIAYQNDDYFHFPLVNSLPSFPISTNKNSNPRYQAFIASFNAQNFMILGEESDQDFDRKFDGQSNDQFGGGSGGSVVDGQGLYWWRKYDEGNLNKTRPRLIELSFSSHFLISQIQLKNSPFWTVHLYSSDHILIDNITINNPLIAPNADGIDVDSSSDVIIRNVFIETSDDHISLKSGENSEGFQFNRSTSNVIIENSNFGIGAGLAIGSETSGGISDVNFVNNSMKLTGNGVRFKTCPHYGYPIENVKFDGLELTNGGIAIYVNENYECSTENKTIPNGGFHYITIENMKGDVGEAGDFSCFDGGCSYFLLENISLQSAIGFRCVNVTNSQSIDVSPPPCF